MTEPTIKPRLSASDARARLRDVHSNAAHNVAEARREIGGKMPDGTVYAGLCEETSEDLFILPNDVSELMPYERATQFAEELNAEKHLGHDDWRIPTRDELKAIFNAKSQGELAGTFDTKCENYSQWYWTSEPTDNSSVWAMNFSGSDIFDSANGVLNAHSVRIVRSQPRSPISRGQLKMDMP